MAGLSEAGCKVFAEMRSEVDKAVRSIPGVESRKVVVAVDCHVYWVDDSGETQHATLSNGYGYTPPVVDSETVDATTDDNIGAGNAEHHLDAPESAQ